MVKFMSRVFVTTEKEGEEEREVEVTRVTGNMRNGLGWTSSQPLRAGFLGPASVSLCTFSPLQQLDLTFRHWGGTARQSGPTGCGHSPRSRLGGKAHTASCSSVAGG